MSKAIYDFSVKVDMRIEQPTDGISKKRMGELFKMFEVDLQKNVLDLFGFVVPEGAISSINVEVLKVETELRKGE